MLAAHFQSCVTGLVSMELEPSGMMPNRSRRYEIRHVPLLYRVFKGQLMSSINFNSSASNALQTLRGINNNLGKTQDRVSTGLKIGDASDGAAYWSIATTMESDNKALGAATDALGIGAAKVDTA